MGEGEGGEGVVAAARRREGIARASGDTELPLGLPVPRLELRVVEGPVVGDPEAESLRPPLRLRSQESECDRLVREIHELSHAVTRCDSDPRCAESPLLCPAALDAEVDHAYRSLREALHARCGFPLGLLDYAWGGPVSAPPSCGASHDWLEATTRGEAPVTRFVF